MKKFPGSIKRSGQERGVPAHLNDHPHIYLMSPRKKYIHHLAFLASLAVHLFLWVPSFSAHADALDDARTAVNTRDFDRAYQLLRPLAEQGNAEAQYNLGVLYRTGRGVTKDYSAAFTWFGKAAAQAHAQAQYNLGVLYLNGWGTAADPDQARHWLELAAAQGVAIASTKLKELHAAPSAVPADADALWSAVRRGDVTQLDALLAHGAAANTRNAGGRTLLMEAADLDQTATGKRLIAAGADVNARDQLGATALMLAARNGNVRAGRCAHRAARRCQCHRPRWPQRFGLRTA